jgi:lysophospholipase L1-like esterase
MRPYVYFHIPGSKYTQKLALYSNKYTINSMGFRGEDFTREPAPGRKRLAIIGDSIVEGHGVQPNQTFPYHLRDKLAGSGWDVLNLGVQGASPLYFAANLERYLYLNPDAVLLLIHENDLYEDELREKAYFSLPVLENREALYSGGAEHPWFEKSRLFTFLRATWQKLSRSSLEKIIERNRNNAAIFQKDHSSPQQASQFIVPPDQIDERWKLSREYLTYFLETLQGKNINLMVSTLCTVSLTSQGTQGKTYCSNLETRVNRWAAQHNVPYLSLVPFMNRTLEEHKKNDVLIFQDLHPTPLTHRLMADELYPFVSGQLTGSNEQ